MTCTCLDTVKDSFENVLRAGRRFFSLWAGWTGLVCNPWWILQWLHLLKQLNHWELQKVAANGILFSPGVCATLPLCVSVSGKGYFRMDSEHTIASPCLCVPMEQWVWQARGWLSVKWNNKWQWVKPLSQCSCFYMGCCVGLLSANRDLMARSKWYSDIWEERRVLEWG